MGSVPARPIYVGKAVPEGARKGAVVLDTNADCYLYKRVWDHAKSIRSAGNLDIRDFSFRFLVVDEVFIALGETLLLTRFMPLWNTTVDGFGNHDPGRGRYNQERSRWDVLHPGRGWASRCQITRTVEQVRSEVLAVLAGRAVPATIDEVASGLVLEAANGEDALGEIGH